MLDRGTAVPNCVISVFAAPLKVNTGLVVDEPVRYAKFVVNPAVGVASKVAVGVISNVGGGGGGGGVVVGGGVTTAAAPPPPPPHPNNGAVMPTPSAIKTARRVAVKSDAGNDSGRLDPAFALMDTHPRLLFFFYNPMRTRKNLDSLHRSDCRTSPTALQFLQLACRDLQ
jgi:hypothetical protein